MSNITHITEANQVQISQHQLERFVDFINNAENGFSALETLVRLIMEKSEKHTTAYTLASITWDKLDDWATVCHEEISQFPHPHRAHALCPLLRRRQPDIPRIHGSKFRRQYHSRHHRLSGHRCGPSYPGGSGHRLFRQ